jgi:hypothetical protein
VVHHLRTSARADFVENAMQVPLHRTLGHAEAIGDVAIRKSRGDETHDLDFSRIQRFGERGWFWEWSRACGSS